jgi:hypothetical protein
MTWAIDNLNWPGSESYLKSSLGKTFIILAKIKSTENNKLFNHPSLLQQFVVAS